MKANKVLGDREITVQREAAEKATRERPRSVDKADPMPNLPRRVMFRDRRPEEVE